MTEFSTSGVEPPFQVLTTSQRAGVGTPTGAVPGSLAPRQARRSRARAALPPDFPAASGERRPLGGVAFALVLLLWFAALTGGVYWQADGRPWGELIGPPLVAAAAAVAGRCLRPGPAGAFTLVWSFLAALVGAFGGLWSARWLAVPNWAEILLEAGVAAAAAGAVRWYLGGDRRGDDDRRALGNPGGFGLPGSQQPAAARAVHTGNAAAGNGGRAVGRRGFPAPDSWPAAPAESFTEAETAALAAAYRSAAEVDSLLRRAGIRPEVLPVFDGQSSALDNWRKITGKIDLGCVPGGRSRILRVAYTDYPANHVFDVEAQR